MSLLAVLSVLCTHHISLFVHAAHFTVMIGECNAVMICCALMLIDLLQACVLDGMIEIRRVAGCALCLVHSHHISLFVQAVHFTVMIGECDAVMICCELMLIDLLQACVLDGIGTRRVVG